MYRQNYKIQFKNFEGQLCTINIIDKYSGLVNPYNIQYELVDVGGGMMDVIFTWTTPATAFSASIGWSADGISYTSNTGSASSPRTITIAAGSYFYQVVFNLPGTELIYNLDEMTPTIEEWQPGGNPLNLIVNNNGNDLMTVVYGMQAVFQVKTTGDYILSKLLRGEYGDDRYEVEIDIEEKIIFKGFLSMADTVEPFLPLPFITLTAVDNLAALRNKTLRNFYDENPGGINNIISYIAWCLQFTGLSLPINVVFNVREETAGTMSAAPDEHFFNKMMLAAKTFEAETNESQDCLTVLQNILKHCIFIGQRHGEWWIKNVDEFDAQPDYVAVFSATGEFISMDSAGVYYLKNVGIDYGIKWLDESCTVSFSSPAKFVKDTYNYKEPNEVPCNKDFERGELLEEIDADNKKYALECWQAFRENYPTSGDITNTADVYLHKQFLNGYEISRYIVFKYPADTIASNFLLSEEIPVEAGGKIKFGLTRRFPSDVTGSGFYRDNGLQIRLYADDGTTYTLKGETSIGDVMEWFESNADFTINNKYIWFEGDVSRDMTDSESLYGDNTSPKIPKTGFIRICIHQSHVTAWAIDTIIEQFSFEYLPLINGTHNKFTGKYFKVSKERNNLELLDEEVFISDAPYRLAKGALMKEEGSRELYSGLIYFIDGNGFTVPGDQRAKLRPGMILLISSTTSNNITAQITAVSYSIIGSSTVVTIRETTIVETAAAAVIDTPVYVLAERFWNAAVFPGGVPDDTYLHPFAYIQIFNVWNQHRLIKRMLSGNLKGIDSTAVDANGKCDIPSIFHTYLMKDSDEHTDNKQFMLLSYDMDINLCRWNASFKEVNDTAVAKNYSDTLEVKFISNGSN